MAHPTAGATPPQALTVVGHGHWATALVKVLLDSGQPLRWLVPDADDRAHLLATGHPRRYLPQAKLPLAGLALVETLPQALTPGAWVLWAAPATHTAAMFANLPALPPGLRWIWASKGLLPGGLRFGEWLSRHYGQPAEHLAVLSGPGFAAEVARGEPTWLGLGLPEAPWAKHLNARLGHTPLRLLPTADVAGVELAGALKNVFAMLMGLADGLQWGDNRRLQLYLQLEADFLELLRAEQGQAGTPEAVQQRIYRGDLLLTAFGQASRNRQLGERWAQQAGSAQADPANPLDRQVAEGLWTLRQLAERPNLPQLPSLAVAKSVFLEGVTAAQLATLLPGS